MNQNPTNVAFTEFLEALYSDPIRQATARAGKVLVVASLISLCVKLFDAKLEPSSIFPINFQGNINVLPAILMIVVIMLTIDFVLKAWTDVLREKETKLVVLRFVEGERAAAATKAAQAVDDSMDDREEDPSPDAWWEAAYHVKMAAEERVREIEERLGDRDWPRRFRFIRTAIEVILPLSIGLVATVVSLEIPQWIAKIQINLCGLLR